MADMLQQLPACPLHLSTAAGDITLLSVLRFLPGQRLVVKAEYQNRMILLKLLRPDAKGQRNLRREQQGHQLLQAAGLTVPALIFVDQQISDCLAVGYDWIDDARPLSESDLDNPGCCYALMTLMAQLHLNGLQHDDLHTDNLLLASGKLHLVDYAAVNKPAETALSPEASLANLALLIVQFTDAGQRHLLASVKNYFAARDWPTENQRTALQSAIRTAWAKRQHHFLKKCFRACTMTAYQQDFSQQYAFRRDFLASQPANFIAQIESIMNSGEVLKAGNSATVVKVISAGQSLVIKRYNIKSWWHYLKRCWRPSRAANAWRYGRLLELIGIPTPKVFGFVEKRLGPLRREAYLVSEWLPATELSVRYPDSPPANGIAKQIDSVFALLHHYHLQHGDLKASNLLITDQDNILLIDLDAMRQLPAGQRFEHCHQADRQRFKQNWPV